MRKKSMSIIEVKDNILSLKGKMLDIKINKGRKKIVRFCGTVLDVYPSVFTMQLNGDSNVMSYSYSDVICGVISLCACQ